MNERVKRSFLPSRGVMHPDYPSDETTSEKPAQRLSGVVPGWRDNHEPSDEELDRAKSLVRPNVQELVGISYAEYFLHAPADVSLVDWLSKDITARIAESPEFFYGGRP